MTWRTVAHLVLAGALGVAGASCSGSDDEVVIELSPSGWTASGGSVDAGELCPAGDSVAVGYLELDGTPLTPAEGWERKLAWIEGGPDAGPNHRELLQHVCADGSGWFTVAWAFGTDGNWDVTDGAGAYAGMRGSGRLVIECDRESTDPEMRYCQEPRTVATGTVELRAGD